MFFLIFVFSFSFGLIIHEPPQLRGLSAPWFLYTQQSLVQLGVRSNFFQKNFSLVLAADGTGCSPTFFGSSNLPLALGFFAQDQTCFETTKIGNISPVGSSPISLLFGVSPLNFDLSVVRWSDYRSHRNDVVLALVGPSALSSVISVADSRSQCPFAEADIGTCMLIAVSMGLNVTFSLGEPSTVTGLSEDLRLVSSVICEYSQTTFFQASRFICWICRLYWNRCKYCPLGFELRKAWDVYCF